jgi:hypothetical protein
MYYTCIDCSFNCKNVMEETCRHCDVLDLDDPFADFVYNCKEDFVCTDLTGVFM